MLEQRTRKKEGSRAGAAPGPGPAAKRQTLANTKKKCAEKKSFGFARHEKMKRNFNEISK
jgi:hypothetical protein